MRVLKILLISCFMLVAAQSFAFAGSGKAIIPHWLSLGGGGQMGAMDIIYISNISTHDLVVKITLYKEDSSTVTSGPQYSNFKDNNTVIGAGETASFSTSTETDSNGYGIIEWKNKDGEDDTVGLISTMPKLLINNGMPF
ncbi:hypothetical protein [Desulfovibrio gilichinskyi]|uniref:Uncharacterized protein n=1 Tax=Desulfovibrio gilichinskyi TaxID=1519643 RepID=A0A1X7C9S5_9BACT|nr:hypothetical protein [Desulfovibrio gilichinskyi]SME92663.1 hypothetical protein SAMN06295933_0560 [Desulfovibrio gilichinskyi]